MGLFRDRMGRELTFKEALLKIIIRFYNYWLDFELMLLRIVGHIPFHSMRHGFYRLAGLKMGKGSVIHTGANFFQPRNIKIGEDSIIGMGAFLDGRAPLIIGDHVDVASEVMIYNSEHDLESSDFSAREAPVRIGDYVFIGPRVIILPGVKIGKGACIAAGAVVTEDILPFKIAGGIPARELGERKLKKPQYRLGRARLFQ